jgi:23S rRNA (cytidine1920-2'-O)/16S rRNA (cytidine1409-2'-O)-methyltransferase
MSRPRKDIEHPYVGRGGLKLAHALDAFAFDPVGLVCADFGCNVGGFTDCLLQAGAEKVYALDTGYGALDYRLRIDPRVAVMERTNALDVEAIESGVDLVVIDLAWTPQRRALPAALRWLAPTGAGRILSLIKPHYEASSLGREELLEQGVLNECDSLDVLSTTLDAMPTYGAMPIAVTRSPIVGGANRKRKTGNIEWLALVQPAEMESP